MGNITTMAVFIWTINILVFLSQFAMLSMNPDSIQFYNENGTLLKEYSTGGNIVMPNTDRISSELNPSSTSEISESGSGTGIFFIDAIASVKNWFADKVDYFTAIVSGPYNIINSALGNNPELSNFVGAISLLWYGVSILILVLAIFGRSD